MGSDRDGGVGHRVGRDPASPVGLRCGLGRTVRARRLVSCGSDRVDQEPHPPWARSPAAAVPRPPEPPGSRRRRARRRRPRALPVRLRPPLQGLPRPRGRAGCRGLRRPAVRGPAERVRLGRDARDRPGRHGAAHAERGARRPRGDAGHRPADGLARAGPPGRRRVRRAADARRVRRRQPRRGARPAAGTGGGARAPRSRRSALPGAGPRLQDMVDPAPPLDGHGARRLRLLARGGRGPLAGRGGVDGAGQRGRGPDRAADVGRGGVLVRDRRPAPPALGRAPRGGRAARRDGPAARGRGGHGRRRLALRRVVPRPRAAGAGLGPGRRTAAEAVEEPLGRLATRLGEAMADPRRSTTRRGGPARACGGGS